jgi:hypothetical protein
MTVASRTILIGDEIAHNIERSLRKLPGTLPLWTIAMPGWPILPFAAEDAIDEIKKIDEKWRAGGGGDLPVNIIVSAGRKEALFEPDDASDEDLADLASDTKKVASTLKAAGTVYWILPPAMTGERKSRAVIRKALHDSGIRVLDAGEFVADPKATRDKPKEADLPESTYDLIAKKLKTWVPIGPLPTIMLIQPPSGGSRGIVDKSKGAFSAAVSAVSAWSAPAKIAGGVALGAAIVGGIYAASSAGQRKSTT